MLKQIEERNHAIAADYQSICNVVPSFNSICSLDEFKWARMCVCSRNFGLIVNGIQTAALVPYADMLNHYRPRETKWQFDDSLQAFTVVSLQGIHTGDQVYDSYGRKCNHRFLLNYGFSVENNIETDGCCPNEVRCLLCHRFWWSLLLLLTVRVFCVGTGVGGIEEHGSALRCEVHVLPP